MIPKKETDKWTAEDVRVLLTLQPFHKQEFSDSREDYRRNIRKDMSKSSWLRERNRRTGRTTKMMCEAIAYALNGEQVLILFPFETDIDFFWKKVFEAAGKMGWDKRFLERRIATKTVGVNDNLLVDHSVLGS